MGGLRATRFFESIVGNIDAVSDLYGSACQTRPQELGVVRRPVLESFGVIFDG